ncbi:hypothetical protein [Rhodococcus sp. UNC363MFTsu5.1]|uniref:hypothetical protein n=1 Tax=Rhodococcus sp. UNC363MFTsu5.1 TaxID=1449069 RepID=UPI000B1B3202|nr:hypothetical protein [Rhodococcus sp. UNC363MFTsu5.1]
MKIPLWIGVPTMLALSAADSALELQIRAVGAMTRTVMCSMGAIGPERPPLWDAEKARGDTEEAPASQLERSGIEDLPLPTG